MTHYCRILNDRMHVSLTLLRREAFTNLDYVEGHVNLDIPSSESIDNITVKVEGTVDINVVDFRNRKDYHLGEETWP